jgi:short-subunit dehydrogenase involved in D-alanine esterification of teichoic acids
LVSLQDEFALKRVEIIELQNELIEIIEPTVMTLLAETNENTIKTTMTNIWYNKMTIINKAIDEHELLVDDFKKTHEQLQKLESKL